MDLAHHDIFHPKVGEGGKKLVITRFKVHLPFLSTVSKYMNGGTYRFKGYIRLWQKRF